MSKTDLTLQVSIYKSICKDMPGKCRECGKSMRIDEITHCSNKCLFAGIQNSKSVSGIPAETWMNDEPLWV